jgi:hypothetical protein
VQRAIAGMEPDEALQWQLLLRKGETRLDPDQFFRRVDEWFRFAEGERIRLSLAGSHYLRVLVRHCRQTDRGRAAPILQRLARLTWSKREQARWESERT